MNGSTMATPTSPSTWCTAAPSTAGSSWSSTCPGCWTTHRACPEPRHRAQRTPFVRFTSCVPTKCPRRLITETDQVARALEAAALRWPEDGDNRAKLLVHLVEAGHQALLDEAVQRREERLT